MHNWMLDLFLKGSQAAGWHGKLRKRYFINSGIKRGMGGGKREGVRGRHRTDLLLHSVYACCHNINDKN